MDEIRIPLLNSSIVAGQLALERLRESILSILFGGSLHFPVGLIQVNARQ